MDLSTESWIGMVVVCALNLVFEILGVTFVHNPLVRVRDNVRRHTFLRMSYVCFARIFYHRRGAIVNDNFALLASCPAFLCFILANFECPAINLKSLVKIILKNLFLGDSLI